MSATQQPDVPDAMASMPPRSTATSLITQNTTVVASTASTPITTTTAASAVKETDETTTTDKVVAAPAVATSAVSAPVEATSAEAETQSKSSVNSSNNRPLAGTKRKKRPKKNRNWQDFSVKASPSSVELWIGDIPNGCANNKNLTTIFHRNMDVLDGVFQPVMRRLVRRAYIRDGAQMAYAILVFRDRQDADTALAGWQGKELARGFIARMNESTANVVGNRSIVSTNDNDDDEDETERYDPNLWKAVPANALNPSDLLRVLPKKQLNELAESLDDTISVADMARADVMARTNDVMMTLPRESHEHEGHPIPINLRDQLLKVLSELRWPPGSQRKSMIATHYLVLRGGMATSIYAELNSLCLELMKWVGDVGFVHSAIAVTKNFVGSPHVDNMDVSYQYAVSLGSFEGGRLCVEEVRKDGWTTHRIDTHDKVARMDGRFVHWVEPFQVSVKDPNIAVTTVGTNKVTDTPVLDTGSMVTDKVTDTAIIDVDVKDTAVTGTTSMDTNMEVNGGVVKTDTVRAAVEDIAVTDTTASMDTDTDAAVEVGSGGGGGDRYSLIFYASTLDQTKPVEDAVRMPIETIGGGGGGGEVNIAAADDVVG